jgi:hypothetical protein
MTNKLIKLAAVLVLTVMSTACANQWRTADDSISEIDAFSFVNEMSGSLNILSGIEQNQSSVVYFAQSGEASGVAESVMSFGDLGFIAPQFAGFSVLDFETPMGQTSVALVDAYVGEQRSFALIIRTEINGQPFTFVKESTDFSINEDKFEVYFVGNDGREFMLRSYDVDDNRTDELAASIHLKAYDVSSGSERAIGQFSSLRGFGG